jgi:hypothetical protein
MVKSEIELRTETLSDDNLIEMLENKLDYTEEAIQVAEKVMSERGHSKLLNKLEEKQIEEEKEVAKKTKEKAEQHAAIEKVQNDINLDSLSLKYSILKKYKLIAYFLIVFLTSWFILSLITFPPAIDGSLKAIGMDGSIGFKIKLYFLFILVFLWAISTFSLYFPTRVINFLFDLDKKTDR